MALGSDNSWYLFTEKWIKSVYKTGFPNVALAEGDLLPRDIMMTLLEKEDTQWQKLVESDIGDLWCGEGSLETWSWSLNVPVLSSLSEKDEASFLLCCFILLFDHEVWYMEIFSQKVVYSCLQIYHHH